MGTYIYAEGKSIVGVNEASVVWLHILHAEYSLLLGRTTQWIKAHTTHTPHSGEKQTLAPARHKRFDCVRKQLTFAHSGEERLQAEYPVVIAQWPETWHKKCRNVKLQKHKKAKDKHHQIQAVDSFIYYID